MRKSIVLLLFLFSGSLFAADPPNVIVVLADDIGTGDISHYRRLHSNNIILETPNMDALAEAGMIFTQAHSPAALCAPSRYSIMTGNSCYRSRAPWGVWGAYEASPVKDSDLTLGRLMKKAGYQTAFFGKWNLGGDFYRLSQPGTIYRAPRVEPELDVDISRMLDGPWNKGFDYSLTFPVGIQDVPYAVYEDSLWMPLEEDSEIAYITQEKMDLIGVTLDKDEGLGDSNWDPHDMGPLLVNKAVTYINAHALDEKPFFIFYSSQAVHLPHTPPDSLNGIPIAGTTPSKHMDMIKELDVQMGMIIQTLKDQGIYDNTLIIFTSDNGGLMNGATLNSGHKPSSIYRGGKNSRFEGGHRIPFMVSWPDSIASGQSSSEPVLGLDIMATLASITGVEIESWQGMDSYNLQPLTQNQPDARSHSFLMLQGGTGKEVILIEEGWKLIIQMDNSGIIGDPIALYDLNTNIQENEAYNFISSPTHQDKVDYLYAKYREVRKSKVPTKNYELLALPYDHPHIYTEGRIGTDTSLQTRDLYWPGSSLAISFLGESISVSLEDQKGENYYNVLVDGSLTEVLHLEQGKRSYVLAKNLEEGEHRVELHKRNDWAYGWTRFYGFDIYGNATLPSEAKEEFIEFYGNSITTGYGNEDYSGEDQPTGDVTNNYLAYGTMTARNIGAAYSCISHSGIGLMVSWHNMIMPEEYNRLNPADGASLWDFSEKQADIVVINLCQNDSWIVKLPDNPQFIKRFGSTAPGASQIIDAYVAFLQSIRKEYPTAEIICLLGNMDITKSGSPWPGYVKEAARIFNDRVHTLFVPYKNSPGHPKVEEQELIANALTAYIERMKNPPTLSFNIRNSHTGNFIPEANIYIHGDTLITDHNGRAEKVLFPGTYPLQIRADRYADKSTSVSILEDDTVQIELDQTRADAKLVVKLDGSSLSGSTVTLSGESQETSTIGMVNFFDLKTDTTYQYSVEYQEEILMEDSAQFDTDSTIRVYLTSTVNMNVEQKVIPSLYPNPGNNKLIVEGFNGDTGYKIFDLSGKVVLNGRLKDGGEIEISGLASGVYFFKTGFSSTIKFVVYQ